MRRHAATTPTGSELELPVSDSVVARALREALDLAWPQACAGCDAWGAPWCDACARSVAGRPLRVRPSLAPHLVVHSAAAFEGSLRRAVTVFKDEGRSDIAPVLSRLLAVSIATAVAEVEATRGGCATWTLVPVPSSRAATRRRGRFPLGDLVRGAETALGCRGLDGLDSARLLRSARRVSDQSHLGRAQRSANVEGAFAVNERVWRRRGGSGGGIVLVDDVVTSGATLRAAHAALQRVRREPVVVATIAATPRRGSQAPRPT